MYATILILQKRWVAEDVSVRTFRAWYMSVVASIQAFVERFALEVAHIVAVRQVIAVGSQSTRDSHIFTPEKKAEIQIADLWHQNGKLRVAKFIFELN